MGFQMSEFEFQTFLFARVLLVFKHDLAKQLVSQNMKQLLCKPLTLYTPYQIFHHILMCFRENGFEEPSKNEFYEIYDDTLHKFTQS